MIFFEYVGSRACLSAEQGIGDVFIEGLLLGLVCGL